MKYLISAIFIFLTGLCIANNDIDSLKKTLENLSTTEKIDKLNTVFPDYKYNNPAFALKIANLTLDFAKQTDSISLQITPLINSGFSLFYLDKYDSVLVTLNKAEKLTLQLEQADSLNRFNHLSDIENLRGIIQMVKGNYDESLYHFQKAIRTFSKAGNETGEAKAYNNIAIIYRKLENYPNALKYYKNSLGIHERRKDSVNLGISYNNISITYKFLQDTASFLEYANKAVSMNEAVNNIRTLSTSYHTLANYYNDIRDFPSALEYYLKSIKLKKKLNHNKGLALSYNSIATLYLELDRYERSEKYLDSALILTNKYDFIELKKANYQLRFRIDSSKGNFKNAFYNHIKFSNIQDSLYRYDVENRINELEAKYQSDKKEQEIEILNKEKEINSNKLLVQKTINYSIIIILLFLAVSTYLLFRRFKEKQRINTLLSEKNNEIQEKQKEIENQNRKLEEQASRLSELDEVKSRFFTNISHEFRTPLTLIIGPLEQLLTKVKDTDFNNSLHLMLRNANKLLDLINQLLEISKIEKGHIKLKFQKCNLVKEAEYITEIFTSLASERKIKLEFKCSTSVLNGYVDKEKFHKIISNLLSNAFKHTPKGKITMELKKSLAEGKVQIIVSDTGIGIHKDKLPYIFDRFYQIDTNETEQTTGTGIGLSFIKELVQLYKGEIKAESEPDKGTKFILELPVTLEFYSENEYDILSEVKNDENQILVAESETIRANDQEEAKNKESDTILIVEDHSDLRKFVTQNLNSSYNILEAENGEIGIAEAKDKLPDLIITDIMMPKVSGLELTKTLKNDETTSHIPIIMLTAKSSIESKLKGLETEADDYLTKPFNITELQLRIKNLLSSRKKLQEKYKKSITINPSEITTTSVDEKFLNKVLQVVEDNMDNSELSVEMLSEKVGMSRANIHKKLKSLVNQSATEFINSVRLKRAAQLIQQNAGNISEIAYDVGYNNLSYFSRAFKKHFNMTPKEMMAQNHA